MPRWSSCWHGVPKRCYGSGCASSNCESCGEAHRWELCHKAVWQQLSMAGPEPSPLSHSDIQRRLHANQTAGCRQPCASTDTGDGPGALAWTELLLSLGPRESHFEGAGGKMLAMARWRDREQRKSMLRAWVALVQQRLEEGAARAQSCRDEGLQGRRFLGVSGLAEQHNEPNRTTSV